jgi:hypothetical protein
VAKGAAVPAGVIAGAASQAYIDAFSAVPYITDITLAGSGIMKAADWTFNQVKSADDYNFKMYADTVLKYASIGAKEFTNAVNEVEDFMEYLSNLLGLPGIGQDCSKTLVCEFWTGLFCGPYFKCIPLPQFVINDMFYDVADIGTVFKALDSGITESLNSKMSNDFCKEATRPFRPLLKALAATNDNWDGFFDTVSISAGISAAAGAA